MGSCTQALTCLMNIRISIDEKSFNKLEEALVRVERLKRDFVTAAEVDELAELVLAESRNWDEIRQKYQKLAKAWKMVSFEPLFVPISTSANATNTTWENCPTLSEG